MFFSEDITAAAAAKLVKVNRKTVNNNYKVLRETILKETLKETPRGDGGFELEEPYFGAKRGRGKRRSLGWQNAVGGKHPEAEVRQLLFIVHRGVL
ncbi:MAG: hypothetical protein LBD29_04450 [Treponema sp.]|nr:hypothetical protein [Treponema sp.]